MAPTSTPGRMSSVGERTMNARQLEVLKWIVAGCPERVMSGFSYKTTAVALQNRRLAVVSKRNGAWKAEATEAGSYFAKSGRYPEGHWAEDRQPPRSAVLRQRAPRPRADRKVTGLRPAAQMIADVVDAGGELTVTGVENGYWEGLVSSATRHDKVPKGKLLTIKRGKTWADRIIRLEDLPEWMMAEFGPVRVPDQLRTPHPVVRGLRDERDRLRMTREVRVRALRILDAIAKAAVARGYTVAAPKAKSGYGRPAGHLDVIVGEHSNVLAIDELNDRVPHEPTKLELRDKERYAWTRIPTHDQVPSRRLRIRIQNGWAIRQDSFADTKTINLETRLTDLLHELELRTAAAEQNRLRLEREKQERAKQWARIRDEAVVQAREEHRAQTLTSQVERWHRAQQLDAYIDVMARQAAILDDPDRDAAEEWLSWARSYRERVDPLRQSLRLPPDPEFTTDVLAPFMRGFSPNGPAW